MPLKFQQIVVAPWQGDNGMTYSVIGLEQDGRVYRYDAKCDGWIPWSNELATTCKVPHKR